MEKENSKIENQNFNIEIDVNDEKIRISEKSAQMMKKSITYLKLGFWTIVAWLVLGGISVLITFNENGLGGIFAFLFMGAFFVVLLIKMYAYIGDYRIFKETQTRQALDDLLDAQKGYYGFIYLLPLIMIGLALVAFVLGDLLSTL